MINVLQPTNLALDGGGETEHGGAKHRLHLERLVHRGEARSLGGCVRKRSRRAGMMMTVVLGKESA